MEQTAVLARPTWRWRAGAPRPAAPLPRPSGVLLINQALNLMISSGLAPPGGNPHPRHHTHALTPHTSTSLGGSFSPVLAQSPTSPTLLPPSTDRAPERRPQHLSPAAARRRPCACLLWLTKVPSLSAIQHSGLSVWQFAGKMPGVWRPGHSTWAFDSPGQVTDPVSR